MSFEPIHVPYRYNSRDTTEQKVIFALGQLGEATAAEIVNKLTEASPKENIMEKEAEKILRELFDQGLIKAENHDGKFYYNLSKLIKPNTGKTDLNGIEDVL